MRLHSNLNGVHETFVSGGADLALTPVPRPSSRPRLPETLELRGHLDLPNLEASLALIEGKIRPGTQLIVDCSEMTDYESSARSHFVTWHRTHRVLISAVAILTSKPLWHMIVSAMALASGQRMKAFDTRDEALEWLARFS